MSGFDARAYVRKKYGNKEEEEVNELTSSKTESSDEGDGFDARTYITEKYRKLAASEFGLDTLESDLQSMGSTIGNIYNEWQSEETLANIKSSVEAIHGRLNQYQEYQKKYGGADLSDVLGGYQSILDDWDNLSSVYGQYRNADAFNTARKKTQMDTDFSGLSYDEVQSKLKEHEEDSDEYKYLSGYTNYSDLRDFDKALENMTEGDSKDKLQIARNQHALDNAFDSYKGYLEADDFDETSQYVSTIEDRKFLWMDDRYIGDEVYEYINNADGKIRSDLLSDYYAQQSQSQGVSLYAPSKFEEMGLDMLTDEEIGVYNTLYRTEGKEAAEKFLSDMKVTLNKRASEQTAAQMEKTVDDGVLSSIAMSAVSPILNVGGGIYSGIENLSSALKGEEVNPYSPYHSMTNMASDIRQSVGENIEENTNLSIGGQNVANFLYNTGMSVADSALGAFTLGKVYTPLMGMNAYQQKAKELKEAGASDHEVKLTALVSGVAEAAFEYVGIDNLFKIKNVDGWKNAISSVLKQMGTEGLEEIGTEVANVISEQLIRGKDSELVQMYNNLTALGYTEKEARTEMAKQIGSNVAWAGIGGALSGGFMGGAYSGAQYNDLSNTGKQIRSNDRVQEMADMFDMMDLQGLTPEQSEAYRLYGEYLQNGDIDNLSNAKLGNLYQTSEREAINTLQSKKATAAQKTDAANRLYRLGEISTSRSADEKARQQRVKELNTGEVTKINSTGNAVKIEGIRKEGDSTTVLTSEGEAKAEDMTFSSNDAEMLSYAEIMGSEKGSLFLSQYDGKQDVDAYRQSFNLAYAYGESGIGSETALKNKGVLTESQVSEIYKNAVTIKANAKQKAIDAINEQYGSKLVTKGSFDDSVIDYKNSTKDGSKVNWKSLTSTQKRAVIFAKAFSKATGVNIRFVKSEVVDGKHVGKNGSYNPNNNSIEIDVYAGRIDSKALNDSIIPTMSHEITHWMKAKAPAMFSKMQEAVMNTLALDDGMSMDDRVDREMMRMKNAHPDQDVTPEAAIDEIVARACEDMLSNSKKAREFLDGLSESEKKSFAYKVKKTYQNLMDWVNKLLGEYESGSEEAKILRAYEDRLKEVSKLWDQAFEEAVHTNQSLKEAGINGENLVNGISEDGTTIVGENNLQMSERTYREGGREYLEKWLNEKVANKEISKEDADNIIYQTDFMYDLMQDIKENNDLPDYAKWAETDATFNEDGDKVSVIVKNGDYAMNLDASQVCKKRTALNAVLNALVQSNDLSMYTLTETDVAELNAIIKKHDFEIACALCFVDSKRYRVGSWANSFCEGERTKKTRKYGFNEMVRSLVPKGSNIKIDEFNFTGRDITNQPTENLLKDADDSELDFSLIDKIMKDNPPSKTGAKTAQYRYAEAIKNNKELRSILNPSEIISSIGLDNIRVKNMKLYGLINGHQGTAKPKFAHEAVAFGNDILRATSWTADKAKYVGGVRLQSFSDFMANMVFDYVQMISELSARELTSHAYTKEPLFVKLFGLTGMKINMSLVPKVAITDEQKARFSKLSKAKQAKDAEFLEAKKHAGLMLDKNGEWQYAWEDETFDFDVAMDIMADPRYTPNCGTIAVGISDEHITKLLSDDRISMVIPYHKSGLNHIVATMRNIALYNDYTSFQNTRGKDGKKLPTGAADFDFYSDLYGADGKEGTHDPKQTAENYKAWCAERGYLPKFDQFAWHPNYYKLLIDFSVYDINDNMRYTEQEAVKAVYPAAEEFKDLILNGVQKNGVTYGGLKQSQGESTRLTNETRQIVDEFRNRLTEKYGQDVLGTQYSDRITIKEDMTDEERYNILKNKKIPLNAKVDTEKMEQIEKSYNISSAHTLKESERKKLFKKIGEEFNVFKEYANRDVELSFVFSKNNMSESEQKQKGNYDLFAKMFSCFDDVIDSAVGIEVHNRNDEGYKVDVTLKSMYVLVSAFEDGDNIVPVKLEIKEFVDKNNALYVAIALESIKKDEVVKEGDTTNGVTQASRSFIISISDLLKNINMSDERFAKYIPKQFFDQNQYSDRDGDLDSRTLLTNALSTVTQNDEEAYLLKEYREHIDLINIKENELSEITAQIKELSFGKGERDTKKIEYLKRRADKIRNSINYYDKKLLSLEAAGPLKSVVERERAKARKKAYEKNRDYTKQALSSYKERMEQKAKIQSITQKALTLNKWLKNSKTNPVPEVFKPAVVQLLNAIDFSSRQRLGMSGNADTRGQETYKDMYIAKALEQVHKMASKLQVMKAQAQEAESYMNQFDLPEFFLKELENLVEYTNHLADTFGGEYVLNQMSLEQLQNLDGIISTLRQVIKTANESLAFSEKLRISDIGEEFIKYNDSLAEKKMENIATNFLEYDNATPYYVFKRMGKVGMMMFDSFMDGQEKFAMLSDEIEKFAQETFTPEEAQKWSNEVLEFTVLDTRKSTKENPKYKTMKMSVAHAMSIYALNKRKAAEKHLAGGGIRIKDFKVGNSVNKIKDAYGATLSKSELEQIVKAIEERNDRAKEVAEKLQHFMSTRCAELGNEITMRRWAIKQFVDDFYFPMETIANGSNFDKVGSQEDSVYRMLNSNFTKELVPDANNKLVIDNIFDVFAKHTVEMAKYNAFALPMLDAIKVLGYSRKQGTSLKNDGEAHDDVSVVASLNNAFGDGGLKYIVNLMKDLNGAETSPRGETIPKKLMANYKIQAVGNNLRVAFLQGTAYVKASLNLDTKYLLKALVSNGKKGSEKALKHSGIALWKSKGHYDLNIARSVASRIKQDMTVVDKLKEGSLYLAGLGDERTWGRIWNACEYWAEDHTSLQKGTDEFNEAVAKRFREVIVSTQVVDSTLTRSQLMRSKSAMAQTITAFMSEGTMTYNMVADAFYEWSLDARKEGKSYRSTIGKHGKKFVRTVGVYVFTNIIASAFGAAVDAVRDDDDDEKLDEKYLEAFWENIKDSMNPIGMLPILKDIMSAFKGYSPSRFDEQSFTTLYQAYKKWLKVFEGEGNAYKATYKTLQGVSQLTGLPISNAVRDIVAMWNATVGNVYPSLKIK